MKKFLACILALVMVFGLAINASATAAGSTVVGATGTPADLGDVEVTVNAGAVINTYYVIVEWTSLSFTYNANDQRWNAEQHKYDDTGAGGAFVGGNTATITVTNKSDVNITATAATTNESTTDGFKATLDQTTFDLNSYAGLAADTPATDTFTITVSADSTEGHPVPGVPAVANVTVSITKKS